jgi:signal transduction histidine kinase
MDQLVGIKSLAEKTLRSVRDLAMGLRSSMLDDLGLVPALQWQPREFSRRSGIRATVQTDGNLDKLPESLCTCVYGLVRESLTNCARHAHARNVAIAVRESGRRISVTIRDAGVGFRPADPESRGMRKKIIS